MDERSAKSLTSVEQLITCDTKSFSDFYWKLRKLVAMPLLKLTRYVSMVWQKLPSSANGALEFSLSRQISKGMFLVFKDYSTLFHCKMIKKDHVFLNMSLSLTSKTWFVQIYPPDVNCECDVNIGAIFICRNIFHPRQTWNGKFRSWQEKSKF